MNITLIKPVYAAISNPLLKDQNISVANSFSYTQNVLQTLIGIFFLLAVIFFFWSAIMAGIGFITSQGNPDQIKKAQTELTYSVIGLVIVFSLFAITKLLGTVFGIDLLNFSIPTM